MPRARVRQHPESETTAAATARHDAAEDRVLERLQRGDARGAQTELFTLFGESLYSYCGRMIRDRHRAEEVCQRVLLEACRDLEGFERRSSLRTWIFTIARHRCLDEIKAQRARDHRFETGE